MAALIADGMDHLMREGVLVDYQDITLARHGQEGVPWTVLVSVSSAQYPRAPTYMEGETTRRTGSDSD